MQDARWSSITVSSSIMWSWTTACRLRVFSCWLRWEELRMNHSGYRPHGSGQQTSLNTRRDQGSYYRSADGCGYLNKLSFSPFMAKIMCVLSVKMLVFIKKNSVHIFFRCQYFVEILFALVETLIKPKPLLMSMSLYLYSTIKTTLWPMCFTSFVK